MAFAKVDLEYKPQKPDGSLDAGIHFKFDIKGQQRRLGRIRREGGGPPGQLMEPSESPTRELTLEEAVSFAILLQKNEQFVEAREVYRRVLETAPDHPRALHYAGVLAHQQGRNDEALALIERSIALVPDQADWYSNLGIVLQSDDRLDRAIDAYRRAIAIDPSHANAHNNLGVLLRATGQPVEAEAAYRAAIRLDPEHIDAYTNLGILLNGLKRTEEAAACYCKVITLRPKHREARKLLALAHCTLGEIGEAAKIFEEWLEEEPEDPIARHMLAACTGRDVPERASNGFVETTFDSFAASFEAKLETLSYRAPALVAAMLEDSGLEPSQSSRRAGRGMWNGTLRRCSSRLLRAGWSAWICPKGCWRTRRRRTSTTR